MRRGSPSGTQAQSRERREEEREEREKEREKDACIKVGSTRVLEYATWVAEWHTGTIKFVTSLTLGNTIPTGISYAFPFPKIPEKWVSICLLSPLSSSLLSPLSSFILSPHSNSLSLPSFSFSSHSLSLSFSL
jgi:hypothetical protein